jgi:site-specific DNA-methyltransferase (adenine-specific)
MSEGKIYFKAKDIVIYNDDFLTTQAIEEDSVDLIVTSPPYNIGMDYNSFNDSISYEKYLEFTEQWLEKALKLMKDDGRMCLNILLDKNKRGHESAYVDVVTIAKKVGWKYHSTIIWNEGNISRRTAWGSWLSPSAPYVIAPVEMIAVLYKKSWKKQNNGKSDITKEEFIKWTNGLWTFPGESKKRVNHPAPFPLELPKRCIKLFTFVGETVLDPFLGSGTTLVACALLNRRGIGVEIDKNYCEVAKSRLIKEGKVLEESFFEDEKTT